MQELRALAGPRVAPVYGKLFELGKGGEQRTKKKKKRKKAKLGT